MGVRRKEVKKPAVFLDRDGTLIRQVDDIVDAKQLHLFAGSQEAVRLLKKAGFLVFVVTNQPVIGKGLVTKKKVDEMNALLSKRLGSKNIDAWYVCPHRYADGCDCRKPNLALIDRAVRTYKVDLTESFFIGDDMRDIETGRRAHMKTILVQTGKAGKDKEFFDVVPDATASGVLAAAKRVLRLRGY